MSGFSLCKILFVIGRSDFLKDARMSTRRQRKEREDCAGLLVTRGIGTDCEVLVIKLGRKGKFELPMGIVKGGEFMLSMGKVEGAESKSETAKREFLKITQLEELPEWKIQENKSILSHCVTTNIHWISTF